MCIFSTREIVVCLYGVLFVIYILLHKKLRDSFWKVIKSACTIKLFIPFVLILCYSSVFVYFCTYAKLWKWIYLKDIIIWTLIAGVPVCFNAVSSKIEDNYFTNIIVDNLKFTALVQFFSGTFTFNIFIELLLQPLLIVFVLMQYIAEKEQHSAKKIVDTIVGITGLIIIVFTIKNAIDSIGNIEFVDICVSFLLPILLSIIYMPVAYSFAIYARYELLFLRMSFKEPKNSIVRIKHRMKIIWLCKFSYKRITRFLYEYVPKMYTRMENAEFEKILEEFKNRQKVI